MITKVKIFNRFKMDLAVEFGMVSDFPFIGQPWALVSIFSGDKGSELYLTEKTEATLRTMGMEKSLSLCFWDITDDSIILSKLERKFGSYKLFTKKQAKQVWGFLKNIQEDPKEYVLVIHCDAGISRSGSIGLFAAELAGIKMEDFVKENPFLRPNTYVMRLLNAEAGWTPMSAEEEKVQREGQKVPELISRYTEASRVKFNFEKGENGIITGVF